MRPVARFGMLGLTMLLIVIATQIVNVLPARAATIEDLIVTCQQVTISGKTEVNTSYVKATVVLASNLGTVLAQQVVRTRPRTGATYRVYLDIRQAHLAEGTRVFIAVGEWDGMKFLKPATIIGADCNRYSGTPMPTLVPSPTIAISQTFVPSPSPTFIASPTFVSTLPPTPIPSPTFVPTLLPTSTPRPR